MGVCALVQRFWFQLKESCMCGRYERNYKDYFVSTCGAPSSLWSSSRGSLRLWTPIISYVHACSFRS